MAFRDGPKDVKDEFTAPEDRETKAADVVKVDTIYHLNAWLFNKRIQRESVKDGSRNSFDAKTSPHRRLHDVTFVAFLVPVAEQKQPASGSFLTRLFHRAKTPGLIGIDLRTNPQCILTRGSDLEENAKQLMAKGAGTTYQMHLVPWLADHAEFDRASQSPDFLRLYLAKMNSYAQHHHVAKAEVEVTVVPTDAEKAFSAELEKVSSASDFVLFLSRQLTANQYREIVKKKFSLVYDLFKSTSKSGTTYFVNIYKELFKHMFEDLKSQKVYLHPEFRSITSVEMVKALAEMNAPFNPFVEGSPDHSALIDLIEYARTPPSIDLVEAYIQCGCNVNHRSNCGTALSWAMKKAGHPDWDEFISYLRSKGALTPEELRNPDLMRLRNLMRPPEVKRVARSDTNQRHSMLTFQRMSVHLYLNAQEMKQAEEKSYVVIAVPQTALGIVDVMEFLRNANPIARRQAIFFANNFATLQMTLETSAGLPKGAHSLHVLAWDRPEAKMDWNEAEKEKILMDYSAFCRQVQHKVATIQRIQSPFPFEVPVLEFPKDFAYIKKHPDIYFKYAALQALQIRNLPAPVAGEVYFVFAETIKILAEKTNNPLEKLELYQEARRALVKATENGYASNAVTDLQRYFDETMTRLCQEKFRAHVKRTTEVKENPSRVRIEFRNALCYLQDSKDLPKRLQIYDALAESPTESIFKVAISPREFKEQLARFKEALSKVNQLPFQQKYELANDLLKYGLNKEAENLYRELLNIKEAANLFADIFYRLGHIVVNKTEKYEFFAKALQLEQNNARRAEIFLHQADCLESADAVAIYKQCLACKEAAVVPDALFGLACHFYKMDKLKESGIAVDGYLAEVKDPKNKEQFFAVQLMKASTVEEFNKLLETYLPNLPGPSNHHRRAILRLYVFNEANHHIDDYSEKLRKHEALVRVCSEISDLTRRMKFEDVFDELIKKYVDAGQLEFELGYYPDALYGSLNQAIRIAEENQIKNVPAQCYNLRAQIYQKMKKQAEASADFAKALELADGDKSIDKYSLASIYYAYAKDRVENKDSKSASPVCAKLVDLFANSAPTDLDSLLFQLDCFILTSKVENKFNSKFHALEMELNKYDKSKSPECLIQILEKLYDVDSLQNYVIPAANLILENCKDLSPQQQGGIKFLMAKFYCIQSGVYALNADAGSKDRARDYLQRSKNLFGEASELGIAQELMYMYKQELVRLSKNLGVADEAASVPVAQQGSKLA